jgi:hypothetical protein
VHSDEHLVDVLDLCTEVVLSIVEEMGAQRRGPRSVVETRVVLERVGLRRVVAGVRALIT